jgi:hypothetical protein
MYTTRFLYALFVALDANFRLKRRDVSSEEKDPGLATGWSFFGEVIKYMAHLDKNWEYKQPVRALEPPEMGKRTNIGFLPSGAPASPTTRSINRIASRWGRPHLESALWTAPGTT